MKTAEVMQSFSSSLPLSTLMINLEEPAETLLPVMDWQIEWLDAKAAAGLAETSLNRYRADMKALAMNIPAASLPEIRHRLAECSKHYGRAVLRHYVILIKQVLKDVGREADAKQIPLPKRPESRVVVYSDEDQQAMMEACQSLRDRLLIQVLMETGARRGELWNMKIRDVQFDQYSALVWLHGKTGTRRRRVYGALPQLLQYLKEHPHHGNPEAKFWLNQYGEPLSYGGFWRAVHRIGVRALNRAIYPHGFRHSAATRDASQFTDREMMIRHGWRRAETVAVYAHLSSRDVDQKDLALHGVPVRILQDASGLKALLPSQQTRPEMIQK